MQEFIKQFVEQVKSGEVEVYNEFSLQHEIGIFLRETFKRQSNETKKVQFERNVSFFKQNKNLFIKKEMDICIFESPKETPYETVDPQKTHCEVVELKFPRNLQYPKQMFSFCIDIVFLEQLLKAGFKKASLVIFTDKKPFYEGFRDDSIYPYFRKGKPLTGHIPIPIKETKKSKIQEVDIEGTYQVEWHPIMGKLKYAIIEAKRTS